MAFLKRLIRFLFLLLWMPQACAKYCKVTLTTAAFPSLQDLPHPLPPEVLKGFMETTENGKPTEEMLQGVTWEVRECSQRLGRGP